MGLAPGSFPKAFKGDPHFSCTGFLNPSSFMKPGGYDSTAGCLQPAKPGPYLTPYFVKTYLIILIACIHMFPRRDFSFRF